MSLSPDGAHIIPEQPKKRIKGPKVPHSRAIEGTKDKMQIGAELCRFSLGTGLLGYHATCHGYFSTAHMALDDGVPLWTLAARTLAPGKEGNGH